mmetsp:Transcript_4146/g.10249  ORF Transcript_4146/g.10249 Transcript_4146/m.10249 type:complete len:89 (+) Transcript_4146:871-1137(+)
MEMDVLVDGWETAGAMEWAGGREVWMRVMIGPDHQIGGLSNCQGKARGIFMSTAFQHGQNLIGFFLKNHSSVETETQTEKFVSLRATI